MSKNARKIIEQIVAATDSLTPEETAELAGHLLYGVGVSRETVQALLKPLDEEDRAELAAQVEALVGEEE